MKPHSITTWIRRMQTGDQEAMNKVWNACWQPVVARARVLLRSRFRNVSDEEDIASSALESVLIRAQAGDYSSLNNTNCLWRLLWVVVERKVMKHMEHHLAARRNVNKTVLMSDLVDVRDGHGLVEYDQDQPIEALLLAETLETLLREVDGPARKTAELTLEGHSPKEISDMLGVKIWTVYNQLTYIRAMVKRIENE